MQDDRSGRTTPRADPPWHCLPPFAQAHSPGERNYAVDSEKRVIDLAAIF